MKLFIFICLSSLFFISCEHTHSVEEKTRLTTEEGRTTRFITLNKDKPLGGFWDAKNIKDRYLYTGESVSVEVYDISGNKKEGNYKLVERGEFQPTASQTKNSINFKENPRTDTRQGVFDFIKP